MLFLQTLSPVANVKVWHTVAGVKMVVMDFDVQGRW